jgi:uncharacterized protein
MVYKLYLSAQNKTHMYASLISKQLNLSERQVSQTLRLLDDGATIPFIARYRKEQTGGLDELQLADIQKAYTELQEVEKRRAAILKSLKQQEVLTTELEQKLNNSWTLIALEDIYLPYKPKRKTKASIAREKGLEPLAGTLMKQQLSDVEGFANQFVKGEIKSIDEAIEGARHIIAEWMSESSYARESLRRLFEREAIISSKAVKKSWEEKPDDAQKYRDFKAFDEQLKRVPSHRYLALKRAANEGFVKLNIAPNTDNALRQLDRIFIKANNEASDQVAKAVDDAWKRLLKPSLENEADQKAKQKADEEAICVFAENLRQLLLTPPLGPKRTLGIDPGFRSGCKLVCLDDKGDLLHNENIYPHPPQKEASKAMSKINQLVEAYKLDAIAIGNGTAGRETEDLVQRIRFKQAPAVYVVNEAGASVYSASSIARAEFPTYDVTVRGAVSIGRRLMDPLAELVKIDPKAIGVGQYQHDVDQNRLKESLDLTVQSVVNQVGVNLNTASASLLQYVSGIGPKLAENIIAYRSENGAFSGRAELKKVKGLGAKAFEQAAGFLRIPSAKNRLDNSAVHPESYGVVEQMAKSLQLSVKELMANKPKLESLNLNDFVNNTIGLPTLEDIKRELIKPGRDIRGVAAQFSFDPNIRKVSDLKEGMILEGLVSNITNFGAFVNLGVKQDGLVHVSQLADRFVSDPNEIVRLNQQVKVKVLEVDTTRNRIQLTMKL